MARSDPKPTYHPVSIDPDDIGLVILDGVCHRCRIVFYELAVKYAGTLCGINLPREAPITVAMENESSMSEAAARKLDLCDKCFTTLERAVHQNLRDEYE